MHFNGKFICTKKPVKAKVKLQHADLVERNPDKYEGNQFLTGNVVIEYKGDLVYADSAVLYQDKIWLLFGLIHV